MIEDQTQASSAAGGSAEKEDRLFFDAVIYPNRSLPNIGFLVLMGVFGLVSFVAGIVFALMGAWPVLGFFGLDVLLLYLAFKYNYKAGRATEHVTLTRDLLRIVYTDQHGRSRETELQPYWARVDLSLNKDGDVDHTSRLCFHSHGQRHEIAGFLSPPEKAELAHAIDKALNDARR